MSGWAIDLGNSNTRVARWDSETAAPALLELPGICRQPGGTELLAAPRLIPSATEVISDPTWLARLSRKPFFYCGDSSDLSECFPLHLLTKVRKFKRSAREAIDSIQSRLGSVEAGRLSLAPVVDPSGALSLAGGEETAGGLSLGEQES